MRAVVFDQVGRPEDVLAVRDQPTPAPGRGEVLVRMLASPVNPSDLMYVTGTYGIKPNLPATPGFEGVGVVEAAGGGLLGWFRKGRRVAVLNDANGNWAEYTVAAARRVIPVPDDIPDDQAASFFVNPATAWAMTRRVLRVPPGAWLLQTAAGSELGKMVIRLGRRYGFRTANVVRRPEQVDELKSLGADAVVCAPDGPTPDQIAAVAGEGVRFAVDPVGGRTAARVAECLAPGGRLVLYGALSGEPIPLEPRTLMAGGKAVEGFWLGDFMKGSSLPQTLGLIRRVCGLMREGVLRTHVAATYPLEQIREAVRHAAAPGKGGKVLLRIADR